jgi:exopolysaccharide biosynthesis polyprenyl glycosylphosphotransferase
MSARAEFLTGAGRPRKAPRYTSDHAARENIPRGRLHFAQRAEWRAADAALAIGTLALVVVVGNLRDMPQGLLGFLDVRLSVKNVLLIGAFAWVWPLVMSACGLHAPSRLQTGEGEWPRLAVAGAAGCVLAMVFPLTGRSGAVTPVYALMFGAAFVPAARLFRSAVRTAERRRVAVRPRQVVLVGSGPNAVQLYRQFLWGPRQNTNVIGFVDSTPHGSLAEMGVKYLGTIQDLEQVLMHRVVDTVLIGLPVKSHYDDIRESLVACARVGVPASYSADLFGCCPAHPSAARSVAPVMSMEATPSPELLAVKRVVDVAGAAILLVVVAPVMIGVAIVIKLTSRGPVLFAQDRHGNGKRLFQMYKFRTMVVDAERQQEQLEDRNEAAGPVFKIRDDPRITLIGRFLRKSSLDELPQLWNVLTGEMSLVGPRPLRVRDVGKFPEPWLMRRFSMRPGLTCLWQISGRSNVGFDRWIALDLEYIDSWSLWLDLEILVKTLPAVVRGTGAM